MQNTTHWSSTQASYTAGQVWSDKQRKWLCRWYQKCTKLTAEDPKLTKAAYPLNSNRTVTIEWDHLMSLSIERFNPAPLNAIHPVMIPKEIISLQLYSILNLILLLFLAQFLCTQRTPEGPMFPLIFHTACAQQILRVQNFSDAQFCAQCKIGDDQNQLNRQNNFLLC